MKKMILGIALVSAISMGAMAQQPQKARVAGEKTSCTPQGCTTVAVEEACCTEVCPFEGVSNLTDDQKAKLKTIQADQKAKRQAQKAESKKQAKEAQEAKKQCTKNCRKDYLNQVKAVLTPDQYVEFLEIQYLQPQGKGPKAEMKAKRGDGKRGDGKARKGGKGKAAVAGAKAEAKAAVKK